MKADELIDQFLDAVWAEQGLSENTLSAYRSDLRIFAKWLADKSLLTVENAQISGFLAYLYQKGMSNRSTARHLSCLRRFFGYLLRENQISRDPTALIDAPYIGRPLPKSLSEADVEKLLNCKWRKNTF